MILNNSWLIELIIILTATSSRDDLHRRIGGRCSSHNMKVVFKVCCKADDQGRSKLNNATSPSSFFFFRLTNPNLFFFFSFFIKNILVTMTTGRPALPSPTTTATTTSVMTSVAVMNTTTSAPATRSTTLPSSSTRIVPHWKEVEIQSYSVRTTTKKSGKFNHQRQVFASRRVLPSSVVFFPAPFSTAN